MSSWPTALAFALIVSPVVLWVYGKYFSSKAIDGTAKRLPEAINQEIHSRLWVEYGIEVRGLFGWKIGFWTEPLRDEPFEPQHDIYNETKLAKFTSGHFPAS